MGDYKRRRAKNWFRTLKRLARWFPPPEPIDLALLKEIRRGAELFAVALELARFARASL